MGRYKGPHKSSEIVKGITPDMYGHVVQVHSEQRKRGKFQDTLDALKKHALANKTTEINFLTPICPSLT